MLLSVVWDITALSPADSLELSTFSTQEHAGEKRGSYLNDTSKRAAKGCWRNRMLCLSPLYTYFFFFLHPLCLYAYRVSLECSHLEKQYLSFLVEEVFFFFFFLKCNQNTRIILMTFLVSAAGFFESVLSQCIPTLIFSDFSPLCYIGITFLKLIGRL